MENNDNFFRGTNTKDKWETKHVQQYDIDKPYDFTEYGLKDTKSYKVIASRILDDNLNVFNIKSLHEMGCAGGDFVSYVKRNSLKDWEVSAEDFSRTAIESAINRNKDIDIKFTVNDFLLNRINKDYGCITMFETIEHIEEGTNYEILDNILEHCEYAIISTVDTEDDCFGEHISHYKLDTFEKKGYDVVWKSYLDEIYMPDGIYHYIMFMIKGKL